jgi:hypothetical protein
VLYGKEAQATAKIPKIGYTSSPAVSRSIVKRTAEWTTAIDFIASANYSTSISQYLSTEEELDWICW